MVSLNCFVQVGLGDDFPRSMHGQHCNAAVDDFHAVIGADVSDGAAAALIDFAEFGSLEVDVCVIHQPAELAHVFGVGVVGTALAAGTGVLIEANAPAEVCRILAFKYACKIGVIARADIAAEHTAGGECAANEQVGVFACCVYKLCNSVFEIFAVHTGCADGADFFLVGKQAAAGVFGRFVNAEDRIDGSICANAVIVAVTEDHAAVKTEIACCTGGNNFQFGGEEVLFFDIVFFFEQSKNSSFDGLFFFIVEGFAADDNVQLFAFDNNGTLFAHLIAAEVRKQVGNADDGIGGIFTDNDVNKRAVLLCNNAVHCKGHCNPLILFDTAVVMRVEICKIGVLIEGILLKVNAGGVNMSADDVQTLENGLFADFEKHERFAHEVGIDAVAGVELFAACNYGVKVAITLCFCHFNSLCNAFALGFAVVKELDVFGGDCVEL